MSSWILPTTADVGLRAYSSTPERLLEESVKGMLDILIMNDATIDISESSIRHSTWNLESPKPLLYDMWLVRIHEEVLYQLEINDCWIMDICIQLKGTDSESATSLSAQVTWISSDLVEREIEIKAVTRHLLQFRELEKGELCVSEWDHIPDFEGPGWVSDVIFDI